MIKGDDLVHTVDKFRTQETTQSLHGLFLHLISLSSAKAHGGDTALRTGIGGHHDDGIFKVNHSALSIGNTAVIQNLQQDIEYIRMGFFDLVEKHHAVRSAADLI